MNEILTTTHVTGTVVDIESRVIQRCAICGFKLCDSVGISMAVSDDGSVPEFPTWECGRLLRVTEGNPTSFELLAKSDKIPKDSCIVLVED